MDHVRKLDVFTSLCAQCDNAATIVQVEVCDKQAQCRTHRFRMPDELAGDTGRGGAGADTDE
jgi:hypothetical protein